MLKSFLTADKGTWLHRMRMVVYLLAVIGVYLIFGVTYITSGFIVFITVFMLIIEGLDIKKLRAKEEAYIKAYYTIQHANEAHEKEQRILAYLERHQADRANCVYYYEGRPCPTEHAKRIATAMLKLSNHDYSRIMEKVKYFNRCFPTENYAELRKNLDLFNFRTALLMCAKSAGQLKDNVNAYVDKKKVPLDEAETYPKAEYFVDEYEATKKGVFVYHTGVGGKFAEVFDGAMHKVLSTNMHNYMLYIAGGGDVSKIMLELEKRVPGYNIGERSVLVKEAASSIGQFVAIFGDDTALKNFDWTEKYYKDSVITDSWSYITPKSITVHCVLNVEMWLLCSKTDDYIKLMK